MGQTCFLTIIFVAYGNLGISASRKKRLNNCGLKPKNILKAIGSENRKPPTVSQKFGQGWTCPYEILAMITTLTYKIQKL
jgi:hypothetical protein